LTRRLRMALPGVQRCAGEPEIVLLVHLAGNPLTSEVEPMRTSSQGCNVLVVEDHVESADVLARLLRMCGHQVKTAHTAKDALDLAANERFDVMVCDIGLPDGDGCRVFEEVKAMYAVQGIILSGHDSPEILASCKQAGFSAHLTKPVKFETIKAVFDQLCSDDFTHGAKQLLPAR
jgi:CheY-like chemotaxis protein